MNAHSVTGHWALWEKHIEHGDISTGNLMCDPVTKRGVLSDFDLARMGGPNREPGAKDDTGTLAFLALDLLDIWDLKRLVRRRYRHDAESFAWCLIYICFSMEKNERGQIDVIKPDPLSQWFNTMSSSYYSRYTLRVDLFRDLPLHKKAGPLAANLHRHWLNRYIDQCIAGDPAHPRHAVPRSSSSLFLNEPKMEVREPYKEPSDYESLEEIIYVVDRVGGRVIPKSKEGDFVKALRLVASLYPGLGLRMQDQTEQSAGV